MGFLFNKPDNVAGATFPAIGVGMFVAFGGVSHPLPYAFLRYRSRQYHEVEHRGRSALLSKKKISLYALTCSVSDLSQVLYGYDTGTIGGILAMKYWKKSLLDWLPRLYWSSECQRLTNV